jgi:Co/Zn/Cd efflux system component
VNRRRQRILSSISLIQVLNYYSISILVLITGAVMTIISVSVNIFDIIISIQDIIIIMREGIHLLSKKKKDCLRFFPVSKVICPTFMLSVNSVKDVHLWHGKLLKRNHLHLCHQMIKLRHDLVIIRCLQYMLSKNTLYHGNY